MPVVRPLFLLCVAAAALAGRSEPLRAQSAYRDWKHAGSLHLLTDARGAALAASAKLENFPLLVRLDQDSFDFRQAHPQGADLRFTTPDGRPLAYQIESWDAAAGRAAVWVLLPVVEGDSIQPIQLYWGRPEAKSESDGRAVFSERNGYASVWHLGDTVQDEVGTLTSTDTGVERVEGVVGAGRRFPGGKGVFGGDRIPDYPSGSTSHSSTVWVRAERPNATILGWGNEGGGRGSKVRMQLRSPPHVHIDSDFSDVAGASRLRLGRWTHVVHTYDGKVGRVYIDGRLDGAAERAMEIKSPARCWLGGWYGAYDFLGDLDEVRISRVARPADWIRLEYENQRPLQQTVGPVVQPGDAFEVSTERLETNEGSTTTLTGRAGGAIQIGWWEIDETAPPESRERQVGDRFAYRFTAPRTIGDRTVRLQFRAVYADRVRSRDVTVVVRDSIPEPAFTLDVPVEWDGRSPIEAAVRVTNRAALEAADAARLRCSWSLDGVAVVHDEEPERLLLRRSQGAGRLVIRATLDNGGAPVEQTATIAVREPQRDDWVRRTPGPREMPVDGQFFPRDDRNVGSLHCTGALDRPADSVFLRLFADDRLIDTVVAPVGPERRYSLSVPLEAGLVVYRIEFGGRTGDQETVLHTAKNLVCGDVYLIDGQSNAEATDVGPVDPPDTSPWIRSYGGAHPRQAGWDLAVVRDRQGVRPSIGAWGMELAKQLVENRKTPVCILNGAVGGSRIDQHQRNAADPTDPSTIYGRLLARVQAAGLTHGVRAVLWHQGENDQGADGPTGGYGWESYRRLFIAMAAGWKRDYPNVQHYYVFQIWPRACSMGRDGSDNRLREVQRTLPAHFSRLSVMSTLGVKPPGGCHFPLAGYQQFAKLIGPLVERDLYGVSFDRSITAPDLRSARFTNDRRNEIALEFDQPVVWDEKLSSQFFLDGRAKQVTAGRVDGNRLLLALAEPSAARQITYLDGAAWSPDNLLLGANGLAALTFCEVPIQAP